MKQLLALALCLCVSNTSDQVAALRREGPSALARLLERYRSEAAGPARDALEATIDAVAAQRYATVSGLYWYTDLDEAQAAAHASGKPILSLRMLGRLDEELSCANSRFFRVALYANAEVAEFLRENFVLHWSTERPVPKVTVDFGGGRALQTTLAGNSAHYVLDAGGHVIGVLPGLYSPVAFRRELQALLPLASASGELDEAERTARVREFIRRHDAELPQTWSGIGFEENPVFANMSLPGIRQSEATAFSKSMTEAMLLPVFMPSFVGKKISKYGLLRPEESRLDASSLELFRRLAGASVGARALQELQQQFEGAIAADTQLNELRIRPWIHARMLAGPVLPSFEVLNRQVYDEVFWTPRSDPWLGLYAEGSFNALPDGGITR